MGSTLAYDMGTPNPPYTRRVDIIGQGMVQVYEEDYGYRDTI